MLYVSFSSRINDWFVENVIWYRNNCNIFVSTLTQTFLMKIMLLLRFLCFFLHRFQNILKEKVCTKKIGRGKCQVVFYSSIFTAQLFYDICAAHWIKNPLQRTIEHNHEYISLNFSFFQ